MTTTLCKAMTIGGSDSGGGGGIQADLKTYAAFGVYGTSVLTAVTAQNTREVAAIAEVPEEIVIAQIDTVMEDIGADAVKTGMLSARSIVESVVDRLGAWGTRKLVVDPVLVSAGGVPLLKADALLTLQRELLPMALITTPAVADAEALSNRRIMSPEDAHEAARAIQARGAAFVVITGSPGSPVSVDFLFDGDAFTQLPGEPIGASRVHGTRDVFAAAITALLARDTPPAEAIDRAKRGVERALRNAVAIGAGRCTLDPFRARANEESAPTPR